MKYWRNKTLTMCVMNAILFGSSTLLALPAEAWDDRAALKAALDRIGFLRPEDEAPVDG